MKTVAIIGLGTMGSAIKSRLDDEYDLLLIASADDDLSKLSTADVIIIAVKPQSFPELAASLQPFVNDQTIVSIMAGVTISTISRLLSTKKIIRTMPNIGLVSTQSVTGLFSEASENKSEVQDMFDLLGNTIWLENEDQFDSFTALAGSGPAYFFKLADVLKQYAIDSGYDEDTSIQIANGALKSAASVATNDPDSLIKQIASKGGTTQAALDSLDDSNFDHIVTTAIQAANNRSKELSNE
jgi:pyrroline-5-carboxylate reductase